MLATPLDPEVETYLWNQAEILKLGQRVTEAFVEVHRRRMTADEVSGQPPIEEAWIGCELPAAYEAVVKKGLFESVSARTNPRAKSWYRLTAEGVILYKRLLGEHALIKARPAK